jgi:hypothetical protein
LLPTFRELKLIEKRLAGKFRKRLNIDPETGAGVRIVIREPEDRYSKYRDVDVIFPERARRKGKRLVPADPD